MRPSKKRTEKSWNSAFRPGTLPIELQQGLPLPAGFEPASPGLVIEVTVSITTVYTFGLYALMYT